MTKIHPSIICAERCASVLVDYGTDNTLSGCLADLLADARHWCDLNGKDYAKVDRLAYQHYVAEKLDKRRQP